MILASTVLYMIQKLSCNDSKICKFLIIILPVIILPALNQKLSKNPGWRKWHWTAAARSSSRQEYQNTVSHKCTSIKLLVQQSNNSHEFHRMNAMLQMKVCLTFATPLSTTCVLTKVPLFLEICNIYIRKQNKHDCIK